jgi:hypothetical protein
MKKIFLFIILFSYSCTEFGKTNYEFKLEEIDSTIVIDTNVTTVNLDSINEVLDKIEIKVEKIKLITEDNENKSDSLIKIQNQVKIKEKIIKQREKECLILMMKDHYNRLKLVDTVIIDTNFVN